MKCDEKDMRHYRDAKRQQDEADKRAGRAIDPHLRGSSDPQRTPWCVVTRGSPYGRSGRGRR